MRRAVGHLADAACTEMDLEDGLIDWRCVDDSLSCPERTLAAGDIARQRAADALSVLTGRSTT